MLRIVVVAVVGLLLGLGGATALVVLREKEARALAALPADSAAVADSLAQTAPDSATDAPEPLSAQDSLALARALPRPHSAAVDSVPAAAVAAAPAADSAAAPPEPPMDAERLAKLFGSMQPKDAARVLEQMKDTEIQIILGQLRDRQAAAILSSLPPQRAAGISQAVIRGARSIQ